MENETGTQERTGSDGSKEGGVNAELSGGEAVHSDDLLAVAGSVIEEMLTVMDQIGIGENDIDPNDFPRWNAVAKKIANTHVEHRPTCVPTEGSK